MKLEAKRQRFAEAQERRRARRHTPKQREIVAITSSIERTPTGGDAITETMVSEHVTERTPAEAEARVLVEKFARSHAELVAYYRRHDVDDGEARRRADDLSAYLAETARTCPPCDQSWDRLGSLAEVDFEAAHAAFLRVREYALDELDSGKLVAEMSGHVKPLEQARFLAVRETFIDDWQPAGGIEQAMVDMLAQNFCLYLHWTKLAHSRTVELMENMDEELRRYEAAGWKPPRQCAADAVEQAYQLAERYNRIFLRVLRQMRDLRRYAPPVIVNNGGQVNLANQQVNVGGVKA